MDHETAVLKGLQDLPHVHHVLLVVSAADDDVVYPEKCCLTVSNSNVHMLLEGGPRIPQTKRRPLVLEQAEEDGDGGLLQILRVDWDLVVPLPHVDLGENRASSLLSGKVSSMLEIRYTSGSATSLSRRKFLQQAAVGRLQLCGVLLAGWLGTGCSGTSCSGAGCSGSGCSGGVG
jgi:hypothetical protein